MLDSLAGTFAAKGVEFDGMLKSGRTHMQDAVPIRLGQEFAAYGVAIAKGRKFLETAADGLRELGLGGSAVGTGINTHPDYRALGDRQPGADFRAEAHARRGHALGDAVECLHGGCERGVARDRARGDSHRQ